MSLTAPGGHHLALADTAEDAAATFGPLYDDLRVASYDETDAWVDDTLLDSVGLVCGVGLDSALRRFLHRTGDGDDALTLLVGLPADRNDAERVWALAEELALSLETEHVDDDTIVMRVLRSADGRWSSDAPALGARGLSEHDVTVPGPAADAGVDGAADDRTADAQVPGDGPSGRPQLRRLAALGAAAVAVLVLLTVLLAVLIGAAAASLVLLVVVLLAVGGCGVLLALVLRRLGRLAALLDDDRLRDEAQFRRRTDRRTQRLLDLQRESDRKRKARFDRIDASLTELGVAPDRLNALTVLVSRRLGEDRRDSHELPGPD